MYVPIYSLWYINTNVFRGYCGNYLDASLMPSDAPCLPGATTATVCSGATNQLCGGSIYSQVYSTGNVTFAPTSNPAKGTSSPQYATGFSAVPIGTYNYTFEGCFDAPTLRTSGIRLLEGPSFGSPGALTAVDPYFCASNCGGATYFYMYASNKCQCGYYFDLRAHPLPNSSCSAACQSSGGASYNCGGPVGTAGSANPIFNAVDLYQLNGP